MHYMNGYFHNSLALNPDMSDVAMLGKLKQSALVAVAGVQIALTDPVNSLGVTFDSHLAFDKYVNNICCACYFHFHGLRHVCSAMSVDTEKTVVCAVYSS